MAKKKTAAPDPSDATPTTPRRRSTPKRGKATADTAAPIVDLAATANDNGAGLVVVAEVSTSVTPSYEEIAEAAYRRYLRRGAEHGRDFDDWLEAERELRSQS